MSPKQGAEQADEYYGDRPAAWIKRDEHWVRFVGCRQTYFDTPLKILHTASLLPSFHVVREYGSVPQPDWAAQKLQVSLPSGDAEIGMDELTSGRYGPVVSIPLGPVCAGFRESANGLSNTENTIRFHDDFAAADDSVWTGVRLCDVLVKLGVEHVSQTQRYVHFGGPPGDSLEGNTGDYAASIGMGLALDREQDVLLAFEQNGKPLAREHEAHLCVVFPRACGDRIAQKVSTISVAKDSRGGLAAPVTPSTVRLGKRSSRYRRRVMNRQCQSDAEGNP